MHIKKLFIVALLMAGYRGHTNSSSSTPSILIELISIPVGACTFSTVCPLAWPFALLGSGSTTVAGGASTSSTSSGLSTSGSATLSVYANHGDFPGTEENVYEILDDFQYDYGKSSVRGRLIGAVKWFFPTKEAMDNWDEYWKQRKEKKDKIKQEKAELKAQKNKNKNKKLCEPESAVLVDEPEGQVLKVVCFEVIEGEVIAQSHISVSTESFHDDISSSSTSD